MKSSMEWNVIARQYLDGKVGNELTRILRQYALAFAGQAEEIEKLQKRVDEMERRLNTLQ